MDFDEALTNLGFELAQDRPAKGLRTYASKPNRFLTYWVHAYDDGTALFTWEFAVTDYLLEHGMQLGSSERLNLFMFPTEDERGPRDPAWLAEALNRADERLRGVDFADPG